MIGPNLKSGQYQNQEVIVTVVNRDKRNKEVRKSSASPHMQKSLKLQFSGWLSIRKPARVGLEWQGLRPAENYPDIQLLASCKPYLSYEGWPI